MPQLPQPPVWLGVIEWSCYVLCSLALVAGLRRRLCYAIPAAILLSNSFIEGRALTSFIIVLFTYLLAFLFYNKPVNCTRRLIQLSVSICYFFAAANKIHPEFLSGRTMYDLLHYYWDLRLAFQPFVGSLHFTLEQARVMGLLVIATELFLTLGPWFARTRKPAFAVSIAMHSAISIMLNGLEIYGPILWCGLLSFFDKKSAVPSEPSGSTLKELSAASAIAVLLLFMPLRYYFAPAKLFSMTFLDRAPWAYTMFIFHEDSTVRSLRYRDNAGGWHDLPQKFRIAQTASTNDIIALFHYLERQYGQAVEFEVDVDLLRNHFLHHRKVGHYRRSSSGWLLEVTGN